MNRLSWNALSLIAVGSGIGGALRALLVSLVSARAGSGFPVGVLLVNVIGSFVFGLVVRSGVSGAGLSAEARLFLTTGLCGGFTTFSAFSMDVVSGFESGRAMMTAVYVFLSVALSASALWVGMLVAVTYGLGER
jgi:fluoride exporter